MKNLCKIFFLCYMQRTEKVQDRKTITYIIQMNAFEKFFCYCSLAISREVFFVSEGHRKPETYCANLCD